MDSSYFIEGYKTLPSAALGILAMYAVIILYIRLFGLKSFSKMSSYDFAHTIAIGSLIASTVSTGSPSIAVGAAIIGGMFLIKLLIVKLKLEVEPFRKAISNTPLLLVDHGNILEENLQKSKMTKAELRAKLREANVFSLQNVKAVVLETTGDVSVLHGKENLDMNDFVMEGVQRA